MVNSNQTIVKKYTVRKIKLQQILRMLNYICSLLGNETAIKKFGFHITTNIGIIPQNNTWTDDWIV